MGSGFRLILETTEPKAPVVALLRRFTGKAIGELREAIIAGQPFLDVPSDDRASAEFRERLGQLLGQLEAMGIPYRAEVDGERVGPELLSSLLRQWEETRVATGHAIDLESGEPDIKTLEWLKATAPRDVFLTTLGQIVRGEGYRCDDATLAWARRELDR